MVTGMSENGREMSSMEKDSSSSIMGKLFEVFFTMEDLKAQAN